MAWTSQLCVLMAVVVCLVLLLIPTLCIEIITPPESVVVFIGSSAVFTCETRQAQVTWNVNGTAYIQLPFSLRDDLDTDDRPVGDNDVYTLTIPARTEYNGTVVQCVAGVLGGATIESGNASLTLQGVLAPVSDVNVKNSHDSILLSWSPPFSLDVTGVDPDIWYTVLISNVTDDDNPTAVLCTDCHSLTQPHYTFTTANPSLCHKYSFTVIPQNGAGEGSRSEPVEGYFTDQLPEFEGSRVKVDWTSDGEYQTLTLLLPMCSDRPGNNIIYIVYCQSTDTECTNYTSGPLTEENSILTVNASSEELPFDCRWDAVIEASTILGRVNTTGYVRISTFDVRNVTILPIPGGVTLNGSFSDNAEGCFVTLTCEESDLNDTLVALPDTSSSANVTGLGTSSNYSVRIYDLENGLPGHRPAVKIDEVNVTGIDEDAPSRGSSVLLDASIDYATDSGLKITCNFMSDMRVDATCVVVSYIRDSQHLNFAVIPMEEKYPFIIPINETGEYSVAVFGRKGSEIDREPLITKRMYLSRTEITEEPSTFTPNDPKDSGAGEAAIAIVTVAIGTTVIIIIIITISYVGIKWHKKQGKCRHIKNMYNREVQPSPMPEVTLVRKTHPENLLYFELGPRPDGLPQPPATGNSHTQYATIRHPNAPSPVPSEVECMLSGDVTKEAETGPPTLDDVVFVLRPVAKKWKVIGVALKLNENFLDDVFTNMVNDEDCLVEAIDNWVKFHEPSWERLAAALRESGEEELALKCHKEESVLQLSIPTILPTPLSPMEETHTHEADKEFTLPSAANSEFFQNPIMATQQGSDIHLCELVTTDQPIPPSPEESSSELRVYEEGLNEDSNFEITDDDYTPFKQCTDEMVCFTTGVPYFHAVYPETEMRMSTTGRIWPSTERFCNKSVMVCSTTGRAYCATEGATEAVYPTTGTLCPTNEKVVYSKAMIIPNHANVFQGEQPNSSCSTLTLHNTVRVTTSDLKRGTHDTREHIGEEQKPAIAEDVIFYSDNKAHEIGPLSPPTSLSTMRLNSTHDYLVWEDPPTLDLTDQDPDITGYTVSLLTKKPCFVYLLQCFAKLVYLALKLSHDSLKGGIPPTQDLSGQDSDTMTCATSMFQEPPPAYPLQYTKLTNYTVHDVSLSPTKHQLFHRKKSTLKMKSQNGPCNRGCLHCFSSSIELQRTP